MPAPPTPRDEVSRERSQPPDLAALTALAEAQPDLAPAVALERELFDGERRLLRRLGTPWLALSNETLAARVAEGRRLIDWDQLDLDWSELRLRLRQVVDVLRRHDIVEAGDAARLQALGRDAALTDALEQWYEGDANGSAGDGTLADVLSLTVRPFLTRAAEVVQQRVSTDGWLRGTCPMCGGVPGFAVILSSGGRQLVCGRCHGRWVFDARTCPRCLVTDQLRVFVAQEGTYQISACGACKRYIKALDLRRAGRPLFLPLDTVATLPLDRAISAQGFTAD